MQEMTIMGRIVAPYGVLGWVKVMPDTEVIDGLKQYSTWWLGKAGNWKAHQLSKLKIHKELLVVKLDGVDDRDQAFALKGQQIAIPRAELPAPGIDEYYWADLIGLTVLNQESICFGKITSLLETGANDVLVVKPVKSSAAESVDYPLAKDRRERLIPYVADVIQQVDLKKQQLVVDWDEEY
jgi:16S rRNA processing protein RimM